MKTLHPFELGELSLFAAHQPLTEQSNALDAMQPIADHHLNALPADMSVADARKRLMAAPGTIFLVTGASGRWIGLVGGKELAADRILAMVSKTVTPFSLTLGDVMLSRELLQAVSLSELQGATVQDVRRTLSNVAERLLLVVDADARLCGIVCGDEIDERINMPHQVPPRRVAEIVHQLNESHKLMVHR